MNARSLPALIPILFGVLVATSGCAGFGPSATASDEDPSKRPGTEWETSHLFMGVRDTDATLAFWRDGLGATLESDDVLEDEALDAMMGRANVRIRHTFLSIGGTRLHTVETLDRPPEPGKAPARGAIGIGGVSFTAPDLDAARAAAEKNGLDPTPIFVFGYSEPPTRMFFLADPDGIRVEIIEDPE